MIHTTFIMSDCHCELTCNPIFTQISENIGSNTFASDFDGKYNTERNIPAYRIVGDGDTLFVTWEEPADPDPEGIFEAIASVRDVAFSNRVDKDVVFVTNPVRCTCFHHNNVHGVLR